MKGFAVSFSMKREKQDAGDGSLSEKKLHSRRAKKKELERELSQVADGSCSGWECRNSMGWMEKR